MSGMFSRRQGPPARMVAGIIATAAFYLLLVLDANVFAYMHDFEVTDDISMNLEPTIIAPDNAYALHTTSNSGKNAFGLKLGLTF